MPKMITTQNYGLQEKMKLPSNMHIVLDDKQWNTRKRGLSKVVCWWTYMYHSVANYSV